jgi:hypothetical protein
MSAVRGRWARILATNSGCRLLHIWQSKAGGQGSGAAFLFVWYATEDPDPRDGILELQYTLLDH